MASELIYWVENTCGGRIYQGASMDDAVEATGHADATPYVHCADGSRAVVRYTVDDDEGVEVGACGQSYDALAAEVRADLARYGDRAYL